MGGSIYFEGSKDPHKAALPSDAAQAAIGTTLFNDAEIIAAKLASWRHDLHQMPELGCETFKTSEYIQARLTELGVSFAALLDGACVLATFGSSQEGAPCILLRADTDALPIEERSGESWAATNGRAHACGHDMHATALLGAAALLKQREQTIKEFGGTVKLLFQPGEETLTGGKLAVEAGVLKNPRVDAAFAMHVNGRCPMGLMLYGKQAMAGSYTFRIKLVGKGGHGSVPHKCIDALSAGTSIYQALQELVSREVAATDEAVLNIGKFEAGVAANVVPEACTIEGTFRAYDNELIQRIKGRIVDIVQGMAAAHRVSATVETMSEVPPTIVDDEVTSTALACVGYALEDVRFRNIQHAMGCEDFAFITQEVPSAFFMVGAAVQDTDVHYTMHDARIRFDDAELPYMAAAHASVALGWLADAANKN